MVMQIFFPRSIEREAGYKPFRRSTRADEISLQPVVVPSIISAPITQTVTNANPFTSPPASPRQLSREQSLQRAFPDPTSGQYGEIKGYALGDAPEEEPISAVYQDARRNRHTEAWEMVTPPTKPNHVGDEIYFSFPSPPDTAVASPGVPPDTRIHMMVPDRPPRPDIHPMLMNYVRMTVLFSARVSMYVACAEVITLLLPIIDLVVISTE
jgi:hypothetical protein